MISEYIDKGLPKSRILVLLKIPRSTYYHSSPALQLQRGRKRSLTTEKLSGSESIAVTGGQLLEEITDLLSREFV